MLVEKNLPLQACNTLGIVARAHALVRLRSESDVQALLTVPQWRGHPMMILGGGSNIVLTGDVRALVLKVEIPGRRVLQDSPRAWIVEAGAGENWHDFVAWTLQQGLPGLENLALIPGTVGAAPVQNIGAYGVELQDRFLELDAVDLETGQSFTLDAARCGFGYRDSVFKHASRPLGLAGRALITRVRLALPKRWRPELGYADLERRALVHGDAEPTAQQVFDWVCEIRRAKLPDPRILGNAGSFFKNPTVTPEQCADIIARDPRLVHYRLADGTVKLAAAWMIEACGWKGKMVGQAGVFERQALVLVNHGGATGGEVMTLARAIQTSVYERFGILLEPEPVVV
ncbi:MAG: UDP-N-acetylmuramate dehydrogenase [Rhodoferax sp.]|nr:UDP-N-acetylmuramate dehydrogenase [Rhodoferax sp.]